MAAASQRVGQLFNRLRPMFVGVRSGSYSVIRQFLLNVRIAPESGRVADNDGRPRSAISGCEQTQQYDHSKISSARPDSGSGMVMPSARAVFKLMNIWTFLACCTGRSAGLSPLRIRPA